MIHGVFFISCLIMPMLGVFQADSPAWIGVAVLEFWCAYFCPVAALALHYFRGQMEQKIARDVEKRSARHGRMGSAERKELKCVKEQVLAVQRMQDYIEKNRTEDIRLSELARGVAVFPVVFGCSRNTWALHPRSISANTVSRRRQGGCAPGKSRSSTRPTMPVFPMRIHSLGRFTGSSA